MVGERMLRKLMCVSCVGVGGGRRGWRGAEGSGQTPHGGGDTSL